MAKHIFVIGGVLSSLGKGIAASSIGLLLKKMGYKVVMQKFDPYLNVDPGTMSPFQHGEVFVTNDGAETDLDLGNYERFIGNPLNKKSNSTSGQIYDTVLKKERHGDYLGKTVQVIPHITDEIKRLITSIGKDCDIVMTEIGGTVGDIESLPFLEAVRQFRMDVGIENSLFIFLTYVPYIKAAGELKTKPTQHATTKLREIGIQPDLLICRSEMPLNEEIEAKISLFTNVQRSRVINAYDVSTIYEVPQVLMKAKIHERICEHLHLRQKNIDFSDWEKIIDNIKNSTEIVKIAVCGKYTEHQDAYKSVGAALTHAAAANSLKLEVKWVDSEKISSKEDIEKQLSGVNGILVPGGFGIRGIDGKIAIAGFARENKIPFFCKLVSIFSKSYPYKKIHKYCMEINDLIGNSIDYPLQINENLETSFYSNYLNKVSDIYDYIRINNHLLYLRKKLNNIDINELSNQIEQFENKYIDSCRKYLESLGRHRILELSADDRKSLTNYYAVVRQLSGEYPGNKAYAKLKQQQENLFRKISKILPVWSVTNLSAAGHFPFQENIFDLVVIDEASQSDISSSIPLLFRAKKAVIIGDPQQLRHISTINKTLNNRLMQKYNLLSEDNLRFSYSIQSLYHCGRGAVGADEVTLLNEHYRSHFSIIEFSNREWYDGHLDIRTNYDNLIFPPDGHEHIEWANVVGYTFKPHGTSALNETEANKVLKLLDVLLKMYEEHMPSFGIVTPFSAQKNYIIQRLSEKYDEDTIKKHILLANTAHQFQGDERDIVIFSPVISRNASESSIGFLRSTSNLFNVSITRARSILWVVGDRNVCINAGIPYLKNFVEYIDHKKYKNIDYPIGSFESPWEKRLFETLKYEGFEPIRQYQIGPYFVDIALKIDKQKLAIEVDGKYWHSSMSGERLERDLVRDRNIRKMGWDLMRFWVHDLKYNLDSCLTRIRSKFNNNLVT